MVQPMQVSFQRTGERRYAVVVSVPGLPTRSAVPAPGYDADIPHDLVHYVVEAELRLEHGVYGRAARGAGTFIATAEYDKSSRERVRQQRKQRKRERGLRAHSESAEADMAKSERLAALSDIAWRRQAGQRADHLRKAPEPQTDEAVWISRVVARLNALAPLWRQLPVGGELNFEWPRLQPLAARKASER